MHLTALPRTHSTPRTHSAHQRGATPHHRRSRTAAAATGVLMVLGLSACGGSEPERASEDPLETVRGYVVANAEGSLEDVCRFLTVEVNGEKVPADSEPERLEQCVAELQADIDEGDRAPIGHAVWKLLASGDTEFYDAGYQEDIEEWNVSLGTDVREKVAESDGLIDGFRGDTLYELQQLDLATYADDESWYID